MGDLLVAWLSFYLALYVRFGFSAAHTELFAKPLYRVTLYILVLVTVSYIFELYNVSKQRNNLDVLKKIVLSVQASFLGLSAVFFLNPEWMIGRGLLAISLFLFVCLQFSWHMLFRTLFNLPYLAQNIIVIGTGEMARRVGNLIESEGGVNHSLSGYVSYDHSGTDDLCVPREKVLGTVEHLLEISTQVSATEIIITNPEDLKDSYFQNILLNNKLLGMSISDVSSYYEAVTGKLMLENMDINALIYSAGFRRSTLLTATKRVVDVLISIYGILVALPLLPIIVILVKLNSPGPVLYRQVRVGHMGEQFTLYKFRTMDQDAEVESGAVWAQDNDPRISRIGRFLRRSRLDELPQLYNVIIGDMSFIGPRPERPEFVNMLQELIPFYSKRHFLKPGITGWAQIKHPYGSSVEEAFEKLRYDLYYLKNMGPILDTKIFLKTIKVILSQFGGR